MKIALASDHAGFSYKEQVKKALAEQGHEVKDFGTDSAKSCDYPDFVRPAAKTVASGAHCAGTCVRQDSAGSTTTLIYSLLASE